MPLFYPTKFSPCKPSSLSSLLLKQVAITFTKALCGILVFQLVFSSNVLRGSGDNGAEQKDGTAVSKAIPPYVPDSLLYVKGKVEDVLDGENEKKDLRYQNADVPFDPETVQWHKQCGNTIHNATKKAGLLIPNRPNDTPWPKRDSRPPNFAMFRIRVVYSEAVAAAAAVSDVIPTASASPASAASPAPLAEKSEILCDAPNYLFASGDSVNFLKILENQINSMDPSLSPELEVSTESSASPQAMLFKSIKIISSGDCWPKGELLRKNIAELMEFEQAQPHKTRILDDFKIRAKPLLPPPPSPLHAQLEAQCRESLNFRLFSKKDDEKAKKFPLVDKTDKDNQPYINDLFSASILNFGDSEQAIRNFIVNTEHVAIGPLARNFFVSVLEPGKMTDLSAYKASNEKFDHLEQKLKCEYKQMTKDQRTQIVDEKKTAQNKRDALQSQLKHLDSDIIKCIVEDIKSAQIRFVLDIASYYDMCLNCQATFKCDFLKQRQNIEKKCLLMCIAASSNIDDPIKWYIQKRIRDQSAKSKEDTRSFFQELSEHFSPLMSLLVSSQQRY